MTGIVLMTTKLIQVKRNSYSAAASPKVIALIDHEEPSQPLIDRKRVANDLALLEKGLQTTREREA